MSTVLYVQTFIPDKSLIKEHKYKAYLSSDQKEKIIEELRKQVPNIDNYVVTMHVEIDLKLYDTKNPRI